MGSRQRTFRAWVLAIATALACSIAPNENVQTVASALSFCGEGYALTTIAPATASWSPSWGRTQIMIPSTVAIYAPGTTSRLDFVDGTTVSCDYVCPSDGSACALASCTGAYGYGSLVFATTVTFRFTSAPNGTWGEADFQYTTDDGSICTSDTCQIGGVVHHTPANSGLVCSSGQDLCHLASTCNSSGACVQGAPLQSSWNDGDPCTGPDTCDPLRGIYGPSNGSCSLPIGVSSNDPTIATDFSSSISFIYNGGGQTGVQQGAIDARRASVVRGRVLDAGNNNAPLAGVTVKVLGQPQLGSTTSRNDGWYDMVVNGGGTVVLNFVGPAGPRYLRAQRSTITYWHDYSVLDDLSLVRDQINKTTIHRAYNDWQTATSDQVTEGGITRRTRVLFPPNWDIDPSASNWSNPPSMDLTFGAVEFTANSPQAMPGNLPPQSGYTYATELGFQEAVDAEVESVKFAPGAQKQPISYVEPVLAASDALNAPGMSAPIGTYDRVKGAWVAEPNGRIIQIKSCAQGSEAVQVITNYVSQSQADYDAIGMTAAERQKLCLYYSVNTTLWRVVASHFSAFDINWAIGQPPNTNTCLPPNDGPVADTAQDDSCKAGGSIIECENRVLGEEIPIVGTPYSLRYQSERQPGYYPGFTIRLTPDQWPNGTSPPDSVELHVKIAGQPDRAQSFQNWPGQFGSFYWDRKDGYGRTVQGGATAYVEVRYIVAAATGSTAGFSMFPVSSITGGNRASRQLYISKFYTLQVGGFDAKPLGFGGWTISPHVAYDPGTVTLFSGNGQRRSFTSIAAAVVTPIGGGLGASGDGQQAKSAGLQHINGFGIGPDGRAYLSTVNDHKIRSVDALGVLGTALSVPSCSPSTWVDGADAIGTCIGSSWMATRLAVSRDDWIYVSDSMNRVLKLSPQDATPPYHRHVYLVGGGSRVSSVAGFAGDGQIAAEGTTQFNGPAGMALALDGTLYVADYGNHRIRRIGTDNVVSTILGNGACAFPTSGNIAAGEPICSPMAVAVGPDGSVYATTTDTLLDGRVARVGVDGRVTIVGGGGSDAPIVDNGLATSAKLRLLQDLAFDPGGNLYLLDAGDGSSNGVSIRKIDVSGNITTVVDAAGTPAELAVNGVVDPTGLDGQIAKNARIWPFGGTYGALAYGPDANLYWSEYEPRIGPNNDVAARVRRVTLGAFATGSNILAPASDGSVVYELDGFGRHLKTRRGLKGSTALQMGYGTSGLSLNELISISAWSGSTANITSVARPTAGTVTITAPPVNGSLTTTMTLSGDGYAQKIEWPTGNVQMTYYPNTGLLQTFTDPRGNVHSFTYDSNGRLKVDKNPAQGTPGTSLVGNLILGGYSVLKTTPEGRKSWFTVNLLPGLANEPARASRRIFEIDGVGAKALVDLRRDGSRKTSFTSSNYATVYESSETKYASDPRFMSQAPYWSAMVSKNGNITATELDRARQVALSSQSDVLSLTGTSAIDDAVYYSNNQYTTYKWRRIYDATNNKWTSTTPTGESVVQQLDAYERVTSIHANGTSPAISPNGPSPLTDFTLTYDPTNGRLTNVGRGSRTKTINYDAQTGFVSSIWDNALGRAWTYCQSSGCPQRDAIGRPKTVVLPGPRTLQYDWDASGNMKLVTLPNPAVTHNFTPNNLDLLSGYQPPNAGFWPKDTTYFYDRDSLLTSVATPSSTVTYTYNTQGRLAQRATPASTVTYNHDGATGLLSAVSTTTGPTITFTYLPNGTAGTLPTSVAWSSPNRTISYTYDGRLRLASRTISGGSTVNFYYDEDNVLSSVTLPGNKTFAITRATGANGTGLIASTALQGGSAQTVQTFNYNSYGQLSDGGTPGAPSHRVSIGGVNKYALSYARDAGGRITGKNENNYGLYTEYDWTYGYDARGFLSTVNGGQYATYGYDDHGNMSGPSYDAQDRLTSAYGGFSNLTYTTNGELASVTDPWGADGWYYTYDVLGNLTAVAESGWWANNSWSYVIDGFDRRVGRRVNGTLTQQYLYDEANRIIAELDGNGTLLSEFVYATHANSPDLMIRSGTVYVLVHDQLGSPMMVVSSSGTIVQKRNYGPWGDVYEVYTGGGFSQPFGFAGGLYDDGIWAYRFGARDYNPGWSRWNSKDVQRFAGGLDLYAYCDNDPVNCMDPSGNNITKQWDGADQRREDLSSLLFSAGAFFVNKADADMDCGNYGDAAMDWAFAASTGLGGAAVQLFMPGRPSSSDLLMAAMPLHIPTIGPGIRTTTNVGEVFSHMDLHNGINPTLASERLHGIKAAGGLAANENVIFDWGGNVYHPQTREWLGSMTEGGAKRR